MDNNQRDEPAPSEAIRVSIFDQIYSLRSGKGAAHIRQIAQVVDERMRQIATQTTTFELSRIAVLAALNLADELEDFKSRRDDAATGNEQAEDAPAAAAEDKGRAATDETSPDQTWFDAIFDAEVPVKERSQRLSSQVSNKLQNIRQDNSKDTPTTTSTETATETTSGATITTTAVAPATDELE